MIKIIKGDLLSVEAGFIVHGCNCIGAMGSGVAKVMREKYPEVYEQYAELCENRKSSGRLESLLGTCQYIRINDQLIVVNAFTQLMPGTHARMVNYDAIVSCFEDINIKLTEVENINQTISFPKIGAGLAGGRWDIISGIIDTVVSEKFNKNLYVID